MLSKKNVWYKPQMRDFKLECCDCGLTHTLDFKTDGKRVAFKIRRDNKFTKKVRDRKNILLILSETAAQTRKRLAG